MPSGETREGLARRGARLWKVLVVSGMALAAACAGMSKESAGKGSDPGTSSNGSSDGSGRGASGW